MLDLTGREPQPLLAAFDIGTTTLAGALLEGRSGETLAVGSARNPQTAFGADVISRIDAAAREGVEPLQRAVLSGLEQVLREMTGRVGREPEEVVLTVLAGNTCMRHLALGLSPASLGQAPYTPAVRAPLCIPAGELGLPVHPAGKVVALPDLAGFVGGGHCGLSSGGRFRPERGAHAAAGYRDQRRDGPGELPPAPHRLLHGGGPGLRGGPAPLRYAGCGGGCGPGMLDRARL